MFNDIFGEVLRKGLTEDKPPDPGEIQAKRNGNFLLKCRLLRIFNFFLKCRILLFLGTCKKYIKIFKSALFMKLLESLCRYYKQGVPNKNLEQGYWVLQRQQFLLNVHNHVNIRNLDISVISRHSFYVTITSLIMEHEPKNRFPRFFKF